MRKLLIVWFCFICICLCIIASGCGISKSNDSGKSSVQNGSSGNVTAGISNNTVSNSTTVIASDMVETKKLKNVFGLADKTGKYLIVFDNPDGISNPDEYDYAIGDKGISIPIKYLKKQSSNTMDNDRQNMYNFNNMEGYIYQLKEGTAVPDATYYIVNSRHFDLNSVITAKEIDNSKIDNSIIKRIEKIKKRKIKNNWVLSELADNTKICLVEFEQAGDELLASIVLVKDDKILFKDYPVDIKNVSSWEITENGEVDPEMVELLFAANSDHGVLIGINLFSTESERTYLLEENNNDLVETGIKSARYIAPLYQDE